MEVRYALYCLSFESSRYSPFPISALSGTGTGELLDLVCTELKTIEVRSPYISQIFFIQRVRLVIHKRMRMGIWFHSVHSSPS